MNVLTAGLVLLLCPSASIRAASSVARHANPPNSSPAEKITKLPDYKGQNLGEFHAYWTFYTQKVYWYTSKESNEPHDYDDYGTLLDESLVIGNHRDYPAGVEVGNSIGVVILPSIRDIPWRYVLIGVGIAALIVAPLAFLLGRASKKT